jgi:SAM-dependent methyltransferase
MATPFFDPRWFPTPPGTLVLDVGSAEGRLSAHLASTGVELVALELDADLVERSRTVQGDATSLPFASASVDAAIALEVLEHVPDPPSILAECHRVLRPGGRLCVGVPTWYTEQLYKRLHPRYMANATHVRIYRQSRLIEEVEKAGFVVDHIETRNLVPALAWTIHAVLRTDADASGHVERHHRVEPAVQRLIDAWSRAPLVKHLHHWLSRRFGKSWYLYASNPVHHTRSPDEEQAS